MSQSLRERSAGRIRATLAVRMLSGRWLADQIGMSRASLARRLRGDGSFSIDELDAVAKALDIPLVSLITDEDHGDPASTEARAS